MILVVSLDLYGPSAGYEALYAEIKKQGVWWHYMRYTWLLHTQQQPNDIVAKLRPFVQPQDRILVGQMSVPYQGLLPKDAWDWINARMQQK